MTVAVMAPTKTIEKVHSGPWKGGRLTAAALAAVERQWSSRELHPDADRLRIKDTDVRGLELRLSRTGSRSWALSRRLDGRQRRFTIPSSAGTSLAEAREAAVALKAAIGKGVDPLQETRAAKAAKLAKAEVAKDRVSTDADAAPTLAQVLDQFGRTVARGQRSWPVRRETIAAEYRRHLDRPLADLTELHVVAVLDAAAARDARVQGFHGHRYLKQILSWAVEEKKVGVNVAAGISRKRVLGKVSPPKARHRVLSTSELRKIWLALAAGHSDYARIYMMVLLTAKRPGEVATMLWADVDLDNKIWLQKTNKSDRPHIVPLSDAAVGILRAQRPDPAAGVAPLFRSARVFNSLAGGELGRKSANWGRFSNSIMKATGTTGWTRHDLRRTAATLMAEAKVDRGVIEMLLNHAESAGKGLVASIYNRHSYLDEKCAAVETLAARIEAAAAGAVTEDGNVVAMRPAKTAAG